MTVKRVKRHRPDPFKGMNRRAIIVLLLPDNLWDVQSLAEFINIARPDLDTKSLRSAIAGTISDLKNNKGWKIERLDTFREKGRICVTLPRKKED